MRPYLCHHLNSLHIYCRLLNLGVPKFWARKLTAAWERVFHPVVYAKPKGGYGRKKTIAVLAGIMLLIGSLSTASAEVIDYAHSFTLRDYDNNGTVDYIDDTEYDSGFRGLITDVWTDEFFVEFNISGSPSTSGAHLLIDLVNRSWSSLYGSSKDANIAYYAGNGTTNTSVFRDTAQYGAI